MNQPLVAFCIPTYNHGKYLPQCLDSVIGQKWSNLEIWIGDDCSSDGTAEIVESYRRNHPAIRYVRNETNMGMYFNVDSLLRRPDAEYIARLDADDYVHHDYTTRLISLLRQYPQAGYAHSAALAFHEKDGPLEVRRLFRLSEYHGPVKALRDSSRGLKMCANMPIFRRESLESINYLCGTPKSGGDYYMTVRLADAGWGNVYSREVLGYYRLGLSSQWTIQRNIDRAVGLTCILDFLTEAYERRGWSIAPIQRLRRDSAIDLASGIFGRRGITNDDEAVAQECLYKLWPEISSYKEYMAVNRALVNPRMNSFQLRLKGIVKAYLPTLRKR